MLSKKVVCKAVLIIILEFFTSSKKFFLFDIKPFKKKFFKIYFLGPWVSMRYMSNNDIFFLILKSNFEIKCIQKFKYNLI